MDNGCLSCIGIIFLLTIYYDKMIVYNKSKENIHFLVRNSDLLKELQIL